MSLRVNIISHRACRINTLVYKAVENCTVSIFTMASMAVYGFSPYLWPKSEFADVMVRLGIRLVKED